MKTGSDVESAERQRILIVDDNPQNLQVLGRLLQEKNYEIEFATNGKSALEWIGFQQFDLILLDINMPEMDGFEVCQKIRSNKTMNRVPVIFLSADTDRESILRGFELGAQDYVTKPFDSRELIARVNTQLSLKEALEKLENLNSLLEEKVVDRTAQLKSANEKLESMNQKLNELDNAKTEFLRLISHEIRTPLNGMILPLEMLKDPIYQTETMELIEILNTSVKRLEKFSLNALLITKLKTNPYDIHCEDINLLSLINELILENQARLNFNGLKIMPDERNPETVVSCDPILVKKCILNILENALTYSPSGSKIEISTYDMDKYLVLEINDNGPGIPQFIIEKGAEMFTKGKDYNDKSTGIGLPLSKLIMEAHRGLLEFKNKKEGGTIVTLSFRLN